MQKLLDKIRKLVKTTCRRADQDSQGKCTTKTKKEGQCSQNLFCPVSYFFREISPHFITPIGFIKCGDIYIRTSFFFSAQRKMLAITTMFGTGDDIACRNVPLKARKLKTSQKNEIGQLSRQITLYWPQKVQTVSEVTADPT